MGTGFHTKAQPKSLKTTGQRDSPAADRKVWPKKSNTCSSTSSAHLSDRSTRSRLQPPPNGLSDRKAYPEPYFRLRPRVSPTGVCKSPTSDSDHASLRPGYVRTLLIALLRLAQPKPTGAIRPGTPARKGSGTDGESSTQVKPRYRDHTLYTYRNSAPQPP